MAKHREDRSATVPLAQQAEEALRAAATRRRWFWAEPAVWTVRMLTALETEVQGAKWFRLYDKVMSERNLVAALQQVARNDGASGVDHVSIEEFVCRLPESLWEVADADLKGYFDSIPRDRLLARVGRRIADGSVLTLIERFLQAEIMDGARHWTPEAGAPPGAVLSPLLSNIYLDPLDHHLAQNGYEMVRYADDFVILCRTAEDAQRALELVRQWVADNGLTLHPDKTRIVNASCETFDFLGFTFRADKHWPRKKSVAKLKETVRAKTSRSSGDSLPLIIGRLNQSLRGWFTYFRRSDYWHVFSDLDKWVRMRMRSILRRRTRRTGCGRGDDHRRWPNSFFAKHRLYSLLAAYRSVRQPSRR